MNLEMHSWGPPIALNMAATGAESVARVDVEDSVDAVDTVHTVEAVEPETATKVSAPIAKFTVMLQMHAGSRNVLRREDSMMSAFVSSAGFQDMSKSIVSPTNV